MSKTGSIYYKEVKLDRYPSGNKYQTVSRRSGDVYVRIWYIGDEIDPEKTYTRSYCQQHKLGRFANEPKKKSSFLGTLVKGAILAEVGNKVFRANEKDGFFKKAVKLGIGMHIAKKLDR